MTISQKLNEFWKLIDDLDAITSGDENRYMKVNLLQAIYLAMNGFEIVNLATGEILIKENIQNDIT